MRGENNSKNTKSGADFKADSNIDSNLDSNLDSNIESNADSNDGVETLTMEGAAEAAAARTKTAASVVETTPIFADAPITQIAGRTHRPNVAAIVLSSAYPEKCEFFIAQRSDIKDAWQFPQGGIDENESPKSALLRELREEIGTDNVEVLAMYPNWLRYDFPPSVRMAKRYPFAGQEQAYFLVRLRDNADVNIATDEPEFSDFMFLDLVSTLKKVAFLKRGMYRKVLTYFKKNGYVS